MIKDSFIHHAITSPWAYPVDEKTLRVVVCAEKGTVRKGKVLYGDKYTPLEQVTSPLLKRGFDERFDYFEADIELNPPRFRYAFALEGENSSIWLHEQGVSVERSSITFFQYPYINKADLLEVPEWLPNGVVYQVFPDRFEKGDPSLDPKEVTPWNDETPTRSSIYGGDLEGIIQRLPHLQELGITVLYLTPIFTSPSNHKYDTTDYFNIDPHFGDKKALKKLVKKCHAAGIKVILDAVYNHCGQDFAPFQDVIKRGKESQYAEWFHIESFPVQTEPLPNYETFSNQIATMPKLRTEHPGLRNYLLDVARYWIEEFNVDGWRLDVANEVDHVFWREFRKVVKEVNPDAYIIGEIWHESLPWLQGDQFDGVTNYPLRDACLDFFANDRMDAQRFAENIQRNMLIYPEQLLRASWNVLSSHDTERFMTACNGNVHRVQLGVVFNFMWVGTPLIYYGDEIGMHGKNDPDCRKPMVWDRQRWNLNLYELYRTLIQLRADVAALRLGRAKVLYADAADNTLLFKRYQPSSDAHVLVALNNSNGEKTIPFAFPQEVLGQYRWQNLTGDVMVDIESSCLVLGSYGSTVGLLP